MNKMNPVVHFELPAEDTKRMSEFYTKAFGWQTQFLGPEMNNYVLVNTTECDSNGNPKNPGAINGGFFPKNSEANMPSFVIGVGDIKESIKNIKDAGGKIIGEPAEIPGVGLYLVFADTEGNKLSVLQPFNK